MAGLFSAPKPPPIAPLPPLPAPPRPEPIDDPALEPETPATSEAPDTANELTEDQNKARIAILKRRQRGRSGTVATSWRGVLSERVNGLRRKTLLGE